ncbi:MAG: hypothetical protein OEO83_00930 [Alphaproteobacteria bacterium]|nr:hypothetical protein [Alphaproteobacteria bacterium]
MAGPTPVRGAAPFPVWGSARETFALVWRHRFWLLMRALPSTILVGVTFIVTFPRIGVYALWEIALFLISALGIANMMVSCHRLIVLGDPCRRFSDFLPRINDLTYFGVWLLLTIAKWILDAIGAFLGSLVELAGHVFSLGVNILFLIALVRLIALFPLTAIQGKTPFHTAWKLSTGHVERLIGFCVIVGTVLGLATAAAGAAIFYSQKWLAENLAQEVMPKIAADLAATLPFFLGALFLMIVLESVAVAQSLAYRRLSGQEPEI